MRKIAFLGLDNAGKTSIITSITRKFGYEEDVLKLVPTRRIDRDTFSFLGLEFARLDFGGQKQYREDYLKTPGKYLAGTDLIFYVIDAQDFSRYEESIQYLNKILLFLKEDQSYIPIAIFFHKFDPELINDKAISKKIATLKLNLTKYCHDFDIFFFETTIYDVKSIMDGFSSGLTLLFEKVEMFQSLFTEIGKNYNAMMISLFDSSGITIGEFYKPHLQITDKLKIYDLYVEIQRRIVEQNKTMYEFSDKFDDGRRFSGVLELLVFGALEFYLMFIIEEDETNLGKTVTILDKIEAAKPQMENIISQIIE